MARNGRPPRDIDWVQLDSILCTGLGSIEYCSERQLVKEGRMVTQRTITSMRQQILRKIKERFDCTFVEYREMKKMGIKVAIAGKQIAVAMEGHPTLLVWMGKQILGQSDKLEEKIETKIEGNITFVASWGESDGSAKT